jgi:hypothetical protein
MSSKKNFWFFLFLFASALFTRFFGINWASGFGFHPDENNMVNSILSIKKDNLNPNFFAYGQFPLYLTYFTTPKHDFFTVGLTLRFWSAIFSSISIILFYLIGKKIFKSSKLANIFALLIVFTPGLIQLSHFGTTESILAFVFALNIYLSFLFYDHPNNLSLLFFAGLISGIGIATKISAATFVVPICLSFLFIFLKSPKQILSLFLKFLLFITITCLFSVLFSPYNIIDYPQFLSSMKYEIGVADGSIPVFYTRQFINSIPYIFQFQKIFPYTNGIFIFIFSLLGFCFVLKSSFKKNEISPYLLITLFSALIYFIYQGQLFTKWTRFMSPIFFCGPLLTGFFLREIKDKAIQFFFIVLAILPGIFFLNTYFFSDIRAQATNWINQNIPQNSQILSEGGNAVDIPLNNLNHFNITNFDFYSLDEDTKSPQILTNLTETSDYIFIPSRRVFKNQNNNQFPYSQQYYQNLFSGDLGYTLIKTFTKSNSFLLNSENAEETWSVFDNPTIRIFRKNENK